MLLTNYSVDDYNGKLDTIEKSVFILERIREGVQEEKQLMLLWEDDQAQARGHILFLRKMG